MMRSGLCRIPGGHHLHPSRPELNDAPLSTATLQALPSGVLCSLRCGQDALFHPSQIQVIRIQEGKLIRICLSVDFQSESAEAEWCNCCVQVVAAVTWKRTDSLFFVPVWIIILAILAGLLLLALLIFLLYKVNRLKTSASDGRKFNLIIFICMWESTRKLVLISFALGVS